MSAYTKNGAWKDATLLKTEIAELVSDIKNKLQFMDMLVNPLLGDDNLPYGFYTVGNSRLGLPEYYVSGVAVNDVNFRVLYPFLLDLQGQLLEAGLSGGKSIEISKAVNEALQVVGMSGMFQARPIDANRMLYGQGISLRHWLTDEKLLGEATVIQIVWRESDERDFPVHSSSTQLLVDYVPFGTKAPIAPTIGV